MLSRRECLQRLGKGGVGRVAVTVGALPAIFPINYAMLGDDIVFRTGPGTKLAAALDEAIVAFEVDCSDALFHSGWSVLVVGPARIMSDPRELELADRLPLTSWTTTGSDMFVRIEGRLISGRDLTHDTQSIGPVAARLPGGVPATERTFR